MVPGVNSLLDRSHIDSAFDSIALKGQDLVLVSAEVSESCAEAAAGAHAARVGATFIYNVAPSRAIGTWMPDRAIIVVNEHEAMRVSGTTTADQAATILAGTSSRLVVTRGAPGATSVGDGVRRDHPSPVASVVDTTGAGDPFCGALAGAAGERPVLRGGR